MSGKEEKGRAVQAEHRRWNRDGLQARTDAEVLARLERMIEKQPRPKRGETDARWAKRVGTYLKQFRSFFKNHRTRLTRLGVKLSDFGLLDPNAKTVPIEPESFDPRHVEAEERDTLKRLSERSSGVRYHKLG